MKYLKRNNGKKLIENMMKEFYEAVVTINKRVLYEADP